MNSLFKETTYKSDNQQIVVTPLTRTTTLQYSVIFLVLLFMDWEELRVKENSPSYCPLGVKLNGAWDLFRGNCRYNCKCCTNFKWLLRQIPLTLRLLTPISMQLLNSLKRKTHESFLLKLLVTLNLAMVFYKSNSQEA